MQNSKKLKTVLARKLNTPILKSCLAISNNLEKFLKTKYTITYQSYKY